MKNRLNKLDEVAKVLAGSHTRREAIRKIGGGVAGAMLAAVGLGTAGRNSAQAQTAPTDDATEKGYHAVEAVLEHCFNVAGVPRGANAILYFWSSSASGSFLSAHDACTCWSRWAVSVLSDNPHCDQDLAYDVCMIWSGNAPLGRPPWNYEGTPHQNYIGECFFCCGPGL